MEAKSRRAGARGRKLTHHGRSRRPGPAHAPPSDAEYPGARRPLPAPARRASQPREPGAPLAASPHHPGRAPRPWALQHLLSPYDSLASWGLKPEASPGRFPSVAWGGETQERSRPPPSPMGHPRSVLVRPTSVFPSWLAPQEGLAG